MWSNFLRTCLLRIKLQMDISIHRQKDSLEITTVLIRYLFGFFSLKFKAQKPQCIVAKEEEMQDYKT